MRRLRISSSKWIATVASIWILCSCGADTFSIYSSVLKSSQGYDQSTLDTVAFFKDFGSNSGVLAGLLYSAVTVNNNFRGGGPWVVHAAGAIQNFFGYFMMWASVSGLIQRPPVALMCLFIFLSNHAGVFFATANLVTGVQNFPQSSGTIVGVLKGFLGINGAIMVQAYGIFCKGKPSTFILMLALLPTFVSIVLMSFVRIYEANTVDDVKRLNGFPIVALIIAGYLMIILILENIFSLPLWANIITFIFMLLLLASPLGIAIKAQREDSMRFSQMFSSESNHSKENQAKDSLEYHELPDGEGQVHDALDDKILPYEDQGMNLLQALRTMNFWLLFIAMV
ncbi:protein nuclear fusion defective 4 [Quercus suber]|uniref:Protein nuclear fusion defective 4 n=1 Tax=Quercus suber TaxID=58331 RepID=A0AAW0KXA4_QUESU|nr:protein nuclear fusion defective 4 [Quercus suber]